MSAELQSHSQQKVAPMLAPDLRKFTHLFLQNHAFMIEWDHLCSMFLSHHTVCSLLLDLIFLIVWPLLMCVVTGK